MRDSSSRIESKLKIASNNEAIRYFVVVKVIGFMCGNITFNEHTMSNPSDSGNFLCHGWGCIPGTTLPELKCTSRGRVTLGHPNRVVIGEPINGQSNGAKQFYILGCVHKNRKDQYLVMHGWWTGSDEALKTPLGIGSARTRIMLKWKEHVWGTESHETNLIE